MWDKSLALSGQGPFYFYVFTLGKQLASMSLQPTEHHSEDFDEWSLPSSALDERQTSPASRSTGVVRIAPGIAAYGSIFPEQSSSKVPYFSSSPPVHCSTPPPLEIR